MRWTSWAMVACTFFASEITAQAAPDSAARRVAMQRLAFMKGEWSGDAWAMVGRGQRVDVRQTESVRFAVGGQVLVVEGVGRRLVDGMPRDTVFHAFATIDWLPDRGYLLRSFTLAGQQGAFPIMPAENGFSWGMTVPGGKVNYAMRLTPAGEWDERGEFVREGQPGIPTFGMLVRRTATTP